MGLKHCDGDFPLMNAAGDALTEVNLLLTDHQHVSNGGLLVGFEGSASGEVEVGHFAEGALHSLG